MAKKITNIDLASIVPGNNDRTIFKKNEMQELANSIGENGLIQPISARLIAGDTYQIVAGERRFRACQMLGWETIPTIILDISDEQAAALMLAENVARQSNETSAKGVFLPAS